MGKKHVLLAEDEKDIRLSLSLLLKGLGYKVTTAKDGTEALDKLLKSREGENPVHILLVDVYMPELNGIDLIRRICEMGFNLPVVVITGFGNKEMIKQLNEIGICSFLQKPFKINELCEKIEQAFEEQKDYKSVCQQ